MVERDPTILCLVTQKVYTEIWIKSVLVLSHTFPSNL